MPKSNGDKADKKKTIPAAAALGTIAFLAAWIVAARVVDSEIVLPSPLRVLQTVVELFPTRRFLEALGATFVRGIVSFAVSLPLGVAVGVACGLSRAFRSALSPLLTVIRATPVLALILILLVWLPSGAVPIFAAFLMAFPVVVSDVQQGVLSVDPGLLEMARLFRLRRRDLVWSVYAPSVFPYLESSAYATLGLVWKVVVAGEVLSQPLRALGTGMQNARVQLETAEVFAWASAGILLCALSDFALRSSRARKERNAVRA